MKYLLAASALICSLSLFSLWPRYRLTCIYLLASIPATLAFRAESAWLHSWYPWLAGPVVLLRVAAGIEVLHRQTEGFWYWARLTGSAFLLAGMFAGMSWVQSQHPDTLKVMVELRRLLQVWLGALFVVIELFWVSQGGGWYRRADQLAAIFGIMALNHAAVGLLSGILTPVAAHYSSLEAFRAAQKEWERIWNTVQPWSAGIDAAVYLGMAIRCRIAPSALAIRCRIAPSALRSR